MQILPKQSKDFFYVPHMDEVAFFMYLNQEALRIQRQENRDVSSFQKGLKKQLTLEKWIVPTVIDRAATGAAANAEEEKKDG